MGMMPMVRAISRYVVSSVLLSCSVLADEKVVFRCDFDQAVAPGSSEGKLVAGYEGSQSLLIELANRGSRTRRFRDCSWPIG